MSGGSKAPKTYTPKGQAASDAAYQQMASSLGGGAQQLVNNVTPGYQQVVNNVRNNPYAAGAQNAANQASHMGATVSADQLAMGDGLQALGTQMSPYVGHMLRTGLDPQGALYNREQQRNTDQVNVINSMYGVAGSPYGAGVAADSSRNFNMDWQNAQLERGLAALSGAGTAAGQVGGLYTGAANLQGMGLDTLVNAGQLPNQTYLSQQDAQIAALNAMVQGVSGAYQPLTSAIGAQGNYMQLGQSAAAGNRDATRINNQRAQFTQQLISDWAGKAAQAFVPGMG